MFDLFINPNLFGSPTLMAGEAPCAGADVIPLRQPHRFPLGGEKWIPMPSALDRSAQTERTCEVCGIVRVTVHGLDNLAWIEWRWPTSHLQFKATVTPECKAVTG